MISLKKEFDLFLRLKDILKYPLILSLSLNISSFFILIYSFLFKEEFLIILFMFLILQYFNHNIICKLSKLLNNTVVGLDELRRFSDEKFEIDNNLIDFYSCQDSTFLKRIFFLNFIYDLNWIVK